MQLIVYIDDIFLLAESEEMSRDLLECLGFTINTNKSILEPAQSIEFLGFTVNTVTMELSLPAEKLKKSGGVPEIARGRESVDPSPLEINR